MSKIMYKGISYANAGVSSDATSIPIADMTAAFDSTAHMNSTDMTSQEVEDFLADINAQGTPSEYKKLLWTNPDPTSNITNQTIMASGADVYDEIEVIYKTTSYYNGYLTARAPFVAGGHLTLFASGGLNGEFSGAPYNCLRTISMTLGGGLTIDSAVGSFSQGSEANNAVCIPYKIYGIKYERVAPPQLDASDYVVEQGTSDIWTYRKWNSGIAECWGTWTGTLSDYGAQFGGYAYYTTVNFPTGLFISIPLIVYSGTVDSSFALSGTIIGRSASYVNCYAISGASGSQSVSFYLICKGRWK